MYKVNTTAQNIRERAWADYVEPAIARGETTVTILAGDLVRSMALQNRTPAVCSALRSKIFLRQCHLAFEAQEGPPSGMSTTMKFTFRLLDATTTASNPTRFDRLIGIGEETFRQLGGGIQFIEEERARFGSK